MFVTQGSHFNEWGIPNADLQLVLGLETQSQQLNADRDRLAITPRNQGDQTHFMYLNIRTATWPRLGHAEA
jgi:hypothetical protein